MHRILTRSWNTDDLLVSYCYSEEPSNVIGLFQRAIAYCPQVTRVWLITRV